MHPEYPIGIFDSGVGGLTVWQEVRHQLPQESIIYLGDTARTPYGDRPESEITAFVRQILRWLETKSIKMAIAACNTSSALALEKVRQEFSFPLLGIILPGARAAARKGRRIGVIATTATVQSETYPRAIAEIDPHVQVWQVACPELVPLIEANRIDDPYTFKIAEAYLQPLITAKIDTLVMGCTHYPHLKHIFQQILPPHVQYVDPAKYLVRAVAQELDMLGLRNNSLCPPQLSFWVSGNPRQFAQVSRRWLGTEYRVGKVSFSTVKLLS
jgi:glutamate racemase